VLKAELLKKANSRVHKSFHLVQWLTLASILIKFLKLYLVHQVEMLKPVHGKNKSKLISFTVIMKT